MAENIFKVDLAAKKVMLNRTTAIPSCGAIVLFDFKAAFPSVDQGFLISALQKIGMNANWIRYVKALYVRNVQKIGSTDTEGFNADTGIRQGCPLSPVLFAIVADLLFRKLQQELPNSTIRAVADDTAMVIDDMRLLPRIIAIFEEYAGFSNLGLNLKKPWSSHWPTADTTSTQLSTKYSRAYNPRKHVNKSARCTSPRPPSILGL